MRSVRSTVEASTTAVDTDTDEVGKMLDGEGLVYGYDDDSTSARYRPFPLRIGNTNRSPSPRVHAASKISSAPTAERDLVFALR